MEDSNYIKVFTGSFITVQRIKNDLAEININVIVKDETESARLAGFGSSIPGQQDVYVYKDEAEVALKVIDAITSNLQA